MTMWFIILLVIALGLKTENPKPTVIVCHSISCKYNRRCRCTRKEIAVYDNTVTGLCLYHTDSMKDRVLEPMRKTMLFEQYQYETDMLAKREEDAELLKNPNAFSEWMKSHWAGKQTKEK